MPTLQIMIRRNVMSSIRGLISSTLDTHHHPAYQTGPYQFWQTDIMYLCLPNFWHIDFMIAE